MTEKIRKKISMYCPTIKEDIRLLLMLIFLAGIMYVTGVGCPIRSISGISCPGCGMSRALLCLVRFDFRGAWQYHPLSVWMPAALTVWLFRARIGRNVMQILTWSTVILFFFVYGVRMFLGDPVLSFDPGSGIIYKIIMGVQYVLSKLWS